MQTYRSMPHLNPKGDRNSNVTDNSFLPPLAPLPLGSSVSSEDASLVHPDSPHRVEVLQVQAPRVPLGQVRAPTATAGMIHSAITHRHTTKQDFQFTGAALEAGMSHRQAAELLAALKRIYN